MSRAFGKGLTRRHRDPASEPVAASAIILLSSSEGPQIRWSITATGLAISLLTPARRRSR